MFQQLTRVAEEATSVPSFFVAIFILPLEFNLPRILDTLIIVSGSNTIRDLWPVARSVSSPRSAKF